MPIRRTPVTLALLALTALAIPPALAQEAAPAPQAPASQPASDTTTGQFEGLTVRSHELGDMTYRTIVGTLALNDDAGVERGEIFFTYYEATDGEGNPLHESEKRPITYVFNGGPGAASVWLHLGTAGPYRVPMGDDGTPTLPPYEVVPNESTWFTTTDLCFIDPVGTGFSRPATEEKDGRLTDEGRRFYGVDQDAESVGDFIRIHCTRFNRWADAKFLAGESYGTTRAAQLASSLHNRFGLDVNGVILVSTVLDFATIREKENNPLPFAVYLPTYAATAAFHDKSDMEPDQARVQAQAFAVDTYLPALMKGALLSDEDRQAVAEEYARLTGLPVAYVLASDLKVGPFRFMKRLLNEDRKTVGRMDGRMVGYDTDPISDTPGGDPSLGVYYGPYAGSFNAYIREELGYETDVAYEVLSGRTRPWIGTSESTGAYSGGYLNVADDLENAMNTVPGLRLFVASGIYDLATPVFGADYTVAQLDLPDNVRERITQTYYPGGHMMYHVAEAREQLGEDVNAFITEASGNEDANGGEVDDEE